MGEPARVSLTEQQRTELARWVHGQRVEYRLRFRATMVWQLFGEGLDQFEVAEGLATSVKTVRKWRNRYLEGGIEGLRDQYRSGRRGVFRVGQRCELIAIACDNPRNYGYPEGSLWTLNMLKETAKREIAGPEMSRSSVQRTLSEIDLKPHKMHGWLHSRDEHFKEKVNDVVDLYLNPPEDAVVLSIDEMTGVQALERRFETKLPLPGRAGRFEFEYTRHGTTSLIGSLAVHTGEVVARCGATRTAGDLIAFMEDIAAHYSPQKYNKIVIIWDNLNIHHEGADARWTTFNARHGNRFEFHYTPLHASWVNQVEIFFSILRRAVLRWGSFSSVNALEEAMMAFIHRWNTVDGHAFNWTFRGYPLQAKAA